MLNRIMSGNAIIGRMLSTRELACDRDCDCDWESSCASGCDLLVDIDMGG